MEERHIRSLAWFGSLLIFFPTWIGLMHGFQWLLGQLEGGLGWVPAPWIRGLVTFGLLAGCLLVPAYAIARVLDRRFPGSAVRSAAWDRQG
ncbi:MAG TPA: hypothetical protein PKE55_04945 [Kiritimatiellia bacterium]|nr:hypothetical protein [Kiritimatiellia bacterium]